MRGSGATTALPALCATRKWNALEHISLLFFSPLPSPLSRPVSKFCGFFVILFILFCLFYFLTFYKYAMGAHWCPARCHRCYWLAYSAEKSAPVIKCHWPQKMYHPPFFFPIPIYLFYILLYLIFYFYYFIVILFDHE